MITFVIFGKKQNMCLIFFSINEHPEYQLIVAANRDEFYQRPTQQAHWWKSPQILAGKDLEANGTWMAMDKKGRFAALTNYRDPKEFDKQKKSRGHIVVDYFTSTNESTFFDKLKNSRTIYNSYNFISYNQGKMSYYSNRLPEIAVYEKGSFALSNHFMDTAWPKVQQIKSGMAELLKSKIVDKESIFELLSAPTVAPDDQLPHTGVPLDKERMLSSVFIRSEDYGTRSSYILLMDYSGNIEFEEITHTPQKSRVHFSL